VKKTILQQTANENRLVAFQFLIKKLFFFLATAPQYATIYLFNFQYSIFDSKIPLFPVSSDTEKC
jgi:hypothetical protein